MSGQKGVVTVHALSAGSLTLPERYFVTPLEDLEARRTVPSLSFLIQHQTTPSDTPTRIVFDLGIRKDISAYAKPIFLHAMTRKPVSGAPDVISSLALGGLGPDDIDYIILSHVHWDHIGTPSDFKNSKFIVGNGTRDLLQGSSLSNCSHSHFEAALLPEERTLELSDPRRPMTPDSEIKISTPQHKSKHVAGSTSKASFEQPWLSLDIFPASMDVFGDGSLYLISAPGRYVYLAGDSCHDGRLLTGEKQVATWIDEKNPSITCCMHADKAAAEKNLDIIRRAGSGESELGKVEIVFAHDHVWETSARAGGGGFSQVPSK